MSVIHVNDLQTSQMEFNNRGGPKRAPPHLKEPYETKIVQSMFDEESGPVYTFSYEVPIHAHFIKQNVRAKTAQSMLTRNGKYSGDFFNNKTEEIQAITFFDDEDTNDAPQYMVFLFYHNAGGVRVRTVLVNYNDYIQGFTLNTDSPFYVGRRMLVMPRTVDKLGINNYYPDEHTDYSRGISNNRHFNLLTFTWSREDEV